MGIYAEALILYILIFFHGSMAVFTGGAAEASGFSITAEIVNIFTYFAPSLALIWYLIYKARKIEIWAVRPGRKDFTACFITFPCLLFTGFFVTLVGSFVGAPSEKIMFHLPSTFFEWLFLLIKSLLAAYLEESYFRFYLLTKREELNLNAVSALALSVILFSICHIYEGPWGFLNAVISGTILGFVFLRYNSFHGIAAAHALYNISTYVLYKVS